MNTRERSFSILAALTVVAVAALSGAVSATQILYKSVEQLGGESAVVVQGKVAETRSFWNDKHTRILTEVVVSVERTYKGDDRTEVRIVQMGGTVDNVKMTVHGALMWRADEEVLLFLEPAAAGAFYVSGFSQGKFQVERNAQTGEAYVRQPALTGAQLVGAPAAERAAVENVPLDRFVSWALGTKGGSR